MPLMVIKFIGVAAILAQLFPGCDSGTPDRADLEELRREILEMVEDASASDVRFCREIALGVKPCGGPWEYLVYSVETTDSVALQLKVAEYNRLQREYNEETGQASDCAFVTPAGVELARGSCVAAPLN